MVERRVIGPRRLPRAHSRPEVEKPVLGPIAQEVAAALRFSRFPAAWWTK